MQMPQLPVRAYRGAVRMMSRRDAQGVAQRMGCKKTGVQHVARPFADIARSLADCAGFVRAIHTWSSLPRCTNASKRSSCRWCCAKVWCQQVSSIFRLGAISVPPGATASCGRGPARSMVPNGGAIAGWLRRGSRLQMAPGGGATAPGGGATAPGGGVRCLPPATTPASSASAAR